ncbi:MAG: bacillithiol system redox-active protein YtxJ [Gemmatimonadetes bacterium]|nr:bacillithiol system redox-active protein YtxJ [Gemmatimonadota bacterium]
MIRRWLKGLLNESAEDDTPEVPIKSLTTRDELDAALAAPVVVLYKHSPICAVSTWSLREVQRFEREHPDTAVYHIDVILHRELSNWIAQHFGIRHESPQALVVRDGRHAWATSHSGITADALRKQVTPSETDPA